VASWPAGTAGSRRTAAGRVGSLQPGRGGDRVPAAAVPAPGTAGRRPGHRLGCRDGS